MRTTVTIDDNLYERALELADPDRLFLPIPRKLKIFTKPLPGLACSGS